MIKHLVQISFITILLSSLLAAPMFGQGRGQQGQNARPGAEGRGGGRGFTALPSILRMIQERPPASLVVLDLKDVGWEAQVSSLLQQDPLIALNLNIIGLDANGGAGLELIEREGWASGVAKWCLISADGKVLFSSEQVPNPDLIMDAFKGTGLQSRMDVLRRFLAGYPDHAEARLALLGELRAIAEAKSRAVLGISVSQDSILQGRLAPASQNTQVAPPAPPQQIDMGVDGEIWGEYARESDNAFQLGLWKQDSNRMQMVSRRIMGGFGRGTLSSFYYPDGGTSMVSSLGQHSPMMTRLYRRWLPDIEYALGKRPSSINLWNFWLSVQYAAGGGDLKALQSGLVPVPNDRPEDVPPPFVRTQWIQDCISRGDWRMAEDVAREAWENLTAKTGTLGQARLGQTRQSPFGERGGGADIFRGDGTSTFNAMTWNTEAEPYIDVLLRQQKISAADGVVQQWFSQGGWSGAAQRAKTLANRLGYTDLGDRWGTLAPQVPREQRGQQRPGRR